MYIIQELIAKYIVQYNIFRSNRKRKKLIFIFQIFVVVIFIQPRLLYDKRLNIQSNKLSYVLGHVGIVKGAHMGGKGGTCPPLENFKNLEKLFTMIRIYLFKYN
jgi:hypothetical protein